MGHSKSFSVDDGFEFDEACFRRFYKPLSNLPTPPPSSRNSSAAQSPRILAEGETPNSDLLAPAIHLTQMIPPGLSREEPSTATVQFMLSHADLPMDLIALAACILDALPSRFRHSWRMSYPRSRRTSPVCKRHTLPSTPIQLEHDAQADTVLPEVAVLAALMIADKFVADLQEPTSYYASRWGMDIWSCEQINFTERCIMEALGYRILPLWDAQIIKEVRHDIELVRRELMDETSGMAPEARDYELCSNRPMSSGEAVVGLGLQLTPAETPKSQLTAGQYDQETREAFSTARAVPPDYLHLPNEARHP
ncbi:uncharacterized protein BCR38DRAFT_484460 [Pseudomassariella vexata]|uniref:Cyclin N-terminal domain-containing protein n=1 Tax=Pseudomassariella vexata TaxID=1141098 RepID=A0A1Y2E0B6_9PEZI|nr:uncharacterized protein BCR38DRAFT_484460 [Pseudomassariella vexata]ORY64983.1 hypothetical protein BCR38DRAFT_484460 [Pseudomassariella vexata]